MLFNSRKLKKPGLSANRPLNNWALGSILLRRRIKKYPDFASTRFWIRSVFKNFYSGERIQKVADRADKGWAVKRARPSKKVWCSGLGLCLEMSFVFDFGQGLRCGLFIRHCRCHWIMADWFVFLHFFLVPLCWYAISERQICYFLREV